MIPIISGLYFWYGESDFSILLRTCTAWTVTDNRINVISVQAGFTK